MKSVFGTNRVLPLPDTTGEVDAHEHDSTNQMSIRVFRWIFSVCLASAHPLPFKMNAVWDTGVGQGRAWEASLYSVPFSPELASAPNFHGQPIYTAKCRFAILQAEQCTKLLVPSSSLGESVLGTCAGFSPAIEHLKIVPAKIRSISASGVSHWEYQEKEMAVKAPLSTNPPLLWLLELHL